MTAAAPGTRGDTVGPATGGSAAPDPAGAELDGLLADVLHGESVAVLATRLAASAERHVPGHRVVVAARSGAARVYGREIDLPRRAVLVLDRVATGSSPGSTGDPLAPRRADPASSPWSSVADELAAAGLGPPVLLSLVDGSVTVGVLAAFPLLRPSATAPRPGAAADLGRWARVATVALGRAADRSRVRRSALEDDVTGLPNRSLMLIRIREALHRRPRKAMALIHVALDRLDEIEDSLGGVQGEAVVRVAGQTVRSVVRPSDVVGHLRAPAFAVICEGVGPDEAVEIGERVRVALTEPIVVGDHAIACRPGVGVVVATDVDTVNSLLHKAAIAAREAGGRGGSEVVRYRPGTYEAALARIDIERDLRRAIEGRGLHLAYQPQVALADRSVVGVEALVRWDDPDRGAVSPDEFIPVAEETGLVVALGEWAIDTALADIAVGLGDLVVSVNLSARQLDEPGLTERTAEALARHGVEASRLRLEITESALVRDVERSSTLLRSLHDLGVRVSIDDFGTGYASLEHVRRIDVADSLKIDRLFVAGIVTDPRDRAIVAAAVTLGRSLGFEMVAEGVEDPAQVEILVEMGCDAAQGYWFGEPVSAAQIRASLGAEPHAEASSPDPAPEPDAF